MTMRNMDITDAQDKLGIYAKNGLLSLGKNDETFKLSGNKNPEGVT